MKLSLVLTLNIAAMSVLLPSVSAQEIQEARQPEKEQEIVYPDDVKVNLIPVYGDDPCPKSTADEIVVCSIYVEADRYRIPKILRNDPNDLRNEPWTNRAVSVSTLGASGINSCSPSGAGGFTGCTQSLIDAAYAERKNALSKEYGRLIAEERQKRLDLIDGEAEDVERRIVEFEKARAEKEAAEEAAKKAAITDAQIAAEKNALDPSLKADSNIDTGADLDAGASFEVKNEQPAPETDLDE